VVARLKERYKELMSRDIAEERIKNHGQFLLNKIEKDQT